MSDAVANTDPPHLSSQEPVAHLRTVSRMRATQPNADVVSSLPVRRSGRRLRALGAAVGDVIFGERCAGCDRPGAAVCTTCRVALISGRGSVHMGAGVRVVVATEYRGRAAAVVRSVKYRNRRGAARHLGGLLAQRVMAAGHTPDVVTWAPTVERRRRQRGFDHAELIARSTARALGVPCVRLLRRVDMSGPQAAAARAQRLQAPAFTARRSRASSVLIVDDVVTTGATLAAASGALRTAGVSTVIPTAVAGTPAPRRHGVRPIARVA